MRCVSSSLTLADVLTQEPLEPVMKVPDSQLQIITSRQRYADSLQIMLQKVVVTWSVDGALSLGWRFVQSQRAQAAQGLRKEAARSEIICGLPLSVTIFLTLWSCDALLTW